jgi:hypothetical protein
LRFLCYIEQIETAFRSLTHRVVLHGDACGKCRIGTKQSAAVYAVQSIIGYLQHPSVQAVLQVIPELVNRGYQLVTVSEMAAARGVTLENGQKYYEFR